MNIPKLTNPTTQATIALLIVFIIDILVPLGIAIGVLYLFCFFLICRQAKKTILIFAIITSILTIAKLLIFLSPSTAYVAFYNRAITIVVIATVAVLAYRHRMLLDRINEERNTYIKELKEMLFMTSHRVRKPLVTCLGLMELIDSDKPLSEDEMKKVIQHLKSSALELDAFTKDLTTFLYEMEQKNKIKNLC